MACVRGMIILRMGVRMIVRVIVRVPMPICVRMRVRMPVRILVRMPVLVPMRVLVHQRAPRFVAASGPFRDPWGKHEP